MGLFNDRTQYPTSQSEGVPVWFMRQAGRYHRHYQQIRKDHEFMKMCKNSPLAAEITMGPIDEFAFDAAILFSDLLFPLEQLGMGLNYLAGPPQLDWHLRTLSDLERLQITTPSQEFYSFQEEALRLLRRDLLPKNVTLLGFTGGPFTLYTYAVEGQHSGNLVSSKQGLYDGRYQRFQEKLLPLLVDQLSQQARGGADALCLFDTAAGELSLKDYREFLIPTLLSLTKEIKRLHPSKKIIYYSKQTHLSYLQSLEDDHIDVLGIDWRMDLCQAMMALSRDYYLQGNIDPCWLHLPWSDLEKNLQQLWQHVQEKQIPLNRWIFGLGHGVLVGTPEENVRRTVEYVHEHFRYPIK